MLKGNPARGVSYLRRGAKLMLAPELRAFVIIPILINISLFATALYYSLVQFSGWLEQLLGYIPEWLNWLSWILWPMFVLMLLVIMAYSFTIVATLIASPFNGLLAEKAELLISDSPAGDSSLMATLASIPKSLAREVSKFLHYIPLAIGIFIIGLIPLVQVIAPLLWVLLGAWMMAIAYTDYVLDNNRLSFGIAKLKLRQARLSSLGFGGAIMLLTMIPIVNFFIMPAAVCGGVIFWHEELKQEN